jgi:hypothetical protein
MPMQLSKRMPFHGRFSPSTYCEINGTFRGIALKKSCFDTSERIAICEFLLSPFLNT